MRTFLWACSLILFLPAFVSAQNFEQLQKVIEANIPTGLPNDLDRRPPSPELVEACKTVDGAVTQIYALPDLTERDRRWTLPREAFSLIILAYAEPLKYYQRLTLISDELEQRGLTTMLKETEKHVLVIGSILSTRTGNNAVNLDIQPLAGRMVAYAQQFPGKESMDVIDHFLQRIRGMNPAYRDRRLAVAAPVFQEYYRSVNHSARALALDSDVLRATLPGTPMYLFGVGIDGRDFDPNSVKDKVVLLQFWGTWCVHCKAEMPDLLALYEKYRADGFEIIGVNTATKGDQDEKRVKQFLDVPVNGKKIPWTILHEGLGERKNQTSMTKLYGIEELPVLILIGRNGKVLDLHPLLSTLDDRIAKATSLLTSIEWTEEERKQLEEIERKRNEEVDRQIKEELLNPPATNP